MINKSLPTSEGNERSNKFIQQLREDYAVNSVKFDYSSLSVRNNSRKHLRKYRAQFARRYSLLVMIHQVRKADAC